VNGLAHGKKVKDALKKPSPSGTNRQGEAQRDERAGYGWAARDSPRAKRDSVAWRGRLTCPIPEARPSGRASHVPVRSRRTGARVSAACGSAQGMCGMIGLSEGMRSISCSCRIFESQPVVTDRLLGKPKRMLLRHHGSGQNACNTPLRTAPGSVQVRRRFSDHLEKVRLIPKSARVNAAVLPNLFGNENTSFSGLENTPDTSRGTRCLRMV
jgi:hypothetical protein